MELDRILLATVAIKISIRQKSKVFSKDTFKKPTGSEKVEKRQRATLSCT
jgi:hypothetical protein